MQFGAGGRLSGVFIGRINWQCTGTVSPATPWGSTVTLTVDANATFA